MSSAWDGWSEGLNPSYGGVVICPMSSLISDFPKNISVPTYPKSHLELWPSHPTRGAYHDRHGRGEGCGGRGSVLHATGLQGGFFESVSDQQRADERCCSVRRSRVVLTPRRWRQVRGVASALPGLGTTLVRGRRWQTSPVTGESSKETVKTIACGNAG
jgi:hypothetical protein